MARVTITGDAREARKVQVFEPRQSPEQNEVILDEFVLGPRGEREMDLRSATAGYRLLPLGPDDEVPEAEEEGFEPDQEGYLTEAVRAEQDAGKQALGAYEGREPPPGARPHRAATTDAPRPREEASEPRKAPRRKSKTLQSAEETEKSAERTRESAEKNPDEGE
jgi:hypothetical protein